MVKPPVPPSAQGVKALVSQAPRVFNPTLNNRTRIAAPPVYRPAAALTQSKPHPGPAAMQARHSPPVAFHGIVPPRAVVAPGKPVNFNTIAAPAKASSRPMAHGPVFSPIQPARKSAALPLRLTMPGQTQLPNVLINARTPGVLQLAKKSKDERGAEDASAESRINGSGYTDSVALSQTQASAIERPDSELNVTKTVNDGEVPILKAALERFFHYLEAAARKTVNRRTQHTFTLAFDGAYGACTGCRKRIRKFIDLWKEKCEAVLQGGEQATLTITFAYTNEPAEYPRENGKWTISYGWSEDGSGKGPFSHTITKTVTG